MKQKIINISIVVLLLAVVFVPIKGTIDVKAEETPLSSSTDDKYAVIMVGRYFGTLSALVTPDGVQQYYTYYLTDAARMYNMLKDTYGYQEDNIYLLVKTYASLDMPAEFDPNWIDYVSSEANFQMVLNNLNSLTEEDSLLICVIDHGGIEGDGGINWKSPDTHVNTNWYLNSESNAYDESTSTKARYQQVTDDWSDGLRLKLNSPTSVKGFRFNAKNSQYFDKIKFTFYNNGAQDPGGPIEFEYWPDNGWQYYRFDDMTFDEVNIKVHENHPTLGFGIYNAFVYEFDFWPSSQPDDILDVFFGCPLNSIPELVQYILGTDIERIYDYELANYVSGIDAKMYFLLQPCNSGGFIDDLSGDNRVIMTASRGMEPADSWIGPIRWALNFEEDGDDNDDGFISFEEAYNHAAEFVTNQYNDEFMPLIDDNGDGVGHHYTDAGFDPSTPGEDGYLASRSFLIDVPVLDIEQDVFSNYGFPIRHAIDGDWAGAQSFIPTVSKITKVEIYLRKFGIPEFDLTVELREDDPEGTLLDSITFPQSNVPSSWTWFEIDFDDETVTPNTDYLIVIPPPPSGITTSFGYEWGYAFGNQYDDGAFWFTRDGGDIWRDLPAMYEFVFKTYGNIF